MFRADSKERVPDERFRGMNPAFVKQVWEKRRKMAAALRAQQLEEFERQEKANATYEDIVAKYRVISAKTPNQRAGKEIIEEVAREHGYSYAILAGASRARSVVVARHRAIGRVYQERPDMSMVQIGRLFGGRDHSSIWSAVTKLGLHVSQTGTKRTFMGSPR